jgi:hypothetical protein
MEINIEEIASITAIKYIVFLTCIKIFEYKYLELGFFNYYIIALIICDFLFSTYRYNVKHNDNINYTDDVTNDGFSMSGFREEFNDVRNKRFKRQHIDKHIHKYNETKDVKNYNLEQNEDSNIDEITITKDSNIDEDITNIDEITITKDSNIEDEITIANDSNINDSIKNEDILKEIKIFNEINDIDN